MAQGWLQIALLLRGARRARAAARRLHGARLHATSACSSRPSSAPVERLLYRVLRVDPDAARTGRPTRASLLVFSGAVLAAAVRDPAHADASTRSTRRASTRAPGTCRSTRRRRSSPTRTGSSTAARRRCRTSARWPGWPSRTSSRPRSASPSLVALIRGIAARARRRHARATSSRTYADRSSTSCCRSRSSATVVLVSQGVDPDARRHASGGIAARARSPRRRRSRSSAPTAAGSSTSTRRYPFENPTAFSNFVEMFLILLHPGLAAVHLRAHGRQPPPGLDDLRRDVRRCSSSAWPSSTSPSSTARPPSTCGPTRPSAAHRRQHGGQGAALRHRLLRRC